MKIGIDARTINVKGGCRTYAINLLSNINEEKRKNIALFGIENFEDYKCIPEPLNQQNPFFRLIFVF